MDNSNYMAAGQVTQPKIKLPERALPASIRSQKLHDKLLDYLKQRLASDNQRRMIRLKRYASIDRMVSTWQKLSPEDSQRSQKQENTGLAQAIHMNLPLAQTHTDDMVSFYTGVYSPTNGAFFESVSEETANQLRPVVERMNDFAVQSKYHKNLSAALRALVKYNIGGLLTRWVYEDQDEEFLDGGQRVLYRKIDVYNLMWDPLISDPSDIACKAEWAAFVWPVTHRWLVEREQEMLISGAGAVIGDKAQNDTVRACWYKHPPSQANVSFEDAKSSDGTMNDRGWESYGLSLNSDQYVNLAGHEIVEMYCWLSPRDFGLRGDNVDPQAPARYSLWRFLILDNERIVLAMPFDRTQEGADPEFRPKIPCFCGYMQQDEMSESQRSTGELMAPFQNFGSFLLNSHIDQVKSEIFGLRVYDPAAIDMRQIVTGSTSQDVPSKQPGRDVRTIIQKVSGTGTNREPLRDLDMLMQLMQRFFPAQALPSQVAGLDRAVTQQVTALLQGVNRRLQMTMRILDDDILGPARFAGYEAALNDPTVNRASLNNATARRLIGSGVMQLNREMAANAMQQLIFALIQNPESAQQYNVPRLFDLWSRMMNMEVTLSDLVRPQENQQQQQPPAQA